MVVHSAQLPRGSGVAHSFLLEGQLASVLVHLRRDICVGLLLKAHTARPGRSSMREATTMRMRS